jgi:hypothetical protein
MNANLPYRAAAWLGVLNFLLNVVPFFIAPLPPFGPGADLVGFDLRYHDALIVANYLGVIQVPVGLIVLVFIAAHTRYAEDRARGAWWLLILAAAVATAAVTAIITALFSVGPLLPGLGRLALAVLTALGLYSLDVSFALQALLLAAIGVATVRLRHLPPWLGWTAWLAALLSALATFGLLMSSGPLAATSPLGLSVGGFSLPVWILLLSLYWLVRPPSRPAPSAP